MRPPDVLAARQPDLRLVPAALAGWGVVLAGLYLGWQAAAVLGGAGVLAVALGLRGAGARWAPGLLAAGGVTAALALVIGAHAWQVEHHPLRAAAERGAATTLVVTLHGDPIPIAGRGYGGQAVPRRVLWRAELDTAEVAGTHWRAGGKVVLFAPAQKWSQLLPGQRVRTEGLLTLPDRPDLTVAAVQVRGAPQVLTPPSTVQRVADRLRTGLRDAAAAALDPAAAGLLPALVVGDTSRMQPAVEQDFQAAGLAHLTAVSGTNVAIVCGVVLGVARLAGAGPRAAAVLAGLALVGFVVLCRPSPSVLRAAVMGGVTLLALLLGRGRSAVPALAGSVIGLLLVVPALGGAPGFALSVLATGGLVLIAPHWSAGLRQRGVPPGAAEALAIPAAAYAVTAPVIAGLSGQVSLVAVLANLLAAPVVAPATVLGVLAAIAAAVHPGTAEVLVTLAGPAVGWLVGVARHAAGVPDGVLDWPAGVEGGLLLAVFIAIVLLVLRAPRLRIIVVVAVLAALLVLVPTRYVSPGWPPPGWLVVACDVGQGDAVVLSTAMPGTAVLVDAGPDPGAVDRCLDALGVDTLALIVLTHLHTDHIDGLAGALSGRFVVAVAVGPSPRPHWAYAEVRATAAQAGVALVELAAGRRLAWPGLALTVLAPPEELEMGSGEIESAEVNNASLVMRATTPVGRILLTGDIELEAQARLLAAGIDLSADVLKVPHHGSPDTSEEFLQAVSPRVALVSVGADNRYGHPSTEVLGALRAAGVTVLRTDQGGDLAVIATPDGLAVATRSGAPIAP